jgi:cell division protein ZipA
VSELIILTIVLLLSFVGLAWYARRKSQQRSKLFTFNDEPNRDTDAVADEFGAILQQEMIQPTDEDELDSEPVVSLSGESGTTQNKSAQTDTAMSKHPEEEIERRLQSQSTPVDYDSKNGDKPKQDDWELVLVLSVIAKQNYSFNGLEIKRVFEELSLSYGAMKIYNKSLANHQNQILFSVANIMSPGTLEPNELVNLKTKGLVFFATLPKPINGLTLFDDMLDTAIKTANKLNGELCDDQHQPVTDSYLEQVRSKILSFNLTLQMEQNQS